MFKELLVLISIVCTLPCQAEERIEVLLGRDIQPYIQEISQLYATFFKEYPYLFELSGNYKEYIESYGREEKAVAALLFSEDNLVGAITGMPLSLTGKYQKPFAERKYPTSKMFYLGEFVLDPKFRRQGFGKLLFYSFEAAVVEKKYDQITLCQIEDDRYCDRMPEGYIANNGFWENLGFEHHPDIHFNADWINAGEKEKTPHHLVF